MDQDLISDILAAVTRHSSGNRPEIGESRHAGCATCCAVFDAREVVAWHDEWAPRPKEPLPRRWSGKCPRCGAATVIGGCTGLVDDPTYLPIVSLFVREAARERDLKERAELADFVDRFGQPG